MVATKSRTEYVREILERMGIDTPINQVQQELHRLCGQSIHDTAIYNERRALRERNERRREEQNRRMTTTPVEPPPVASPERKKEEVPVTSPEHEEVPVNKLSVLADLLNQYSGQIKQVQKLAEDVGGYDNLITLVCIVRDVSRL